jgi:hypothetical protein
MTCDEVKLSIPEYLSRELSGREVLEMEGHVAECAGCQAELSEMSALWRSMARLPQPEPGPLLRTRFESMLAAYEHGMERGRQDSAWSRLQGRLSAFWPKQPVWQFAVAVACLVAGFFGGSALTQTHLRPANNEMTTLRGEVAAMRQLVTLSLLQQQSPSDRLRGVNWSVRVERPTPEVPAALLFAVNNDDNVNVRLAAVDALHNFTADERTRRSLLAAIPRQDSPLVQIALIDLLAQLHEPETAKALQRLADQPRLDESVRAFAQRAAGKMHFE